MPQEYVQVIVTMTERMRDEIAAAVEVEHQLRPQVYYAAPDLIREAVAKYLGTDVYGYKLAT